MSRIVGLSPFYWSPFYCSAEPARAKALEEYDTFARHRVQWEDQRAETEGLERVAKQIEKKGRDG